MDSYYCKGTQRPMGGAMVSLVVAALLVTSTFGLALASRSWGAGAATAVERSGVFGRSGGTRPSCNRAAGKFRVAASST